MKKVTLLLFLAALVLTFSSCSKDDDGCYHFDEPSMAPSADNAQL